MTTAPTSNSTTPPTTTGTTASASSNSSISGDFNQFLSLLTTQLKYQDPLSPMDSTQFTAQLAQFATVEQTSNMNTNLQSLITLTKSNQTADAVSYLGKMVQVNNPTTGLQNGEATYTYTLPSQSAATVLSIKNSLGKVVYATSGSTSAGTQTFTWNGQDANGNQLPDGDYTLGVTAADAKGTPITATVGSIGTVTAIDSSSGTLNLVVDGVEVPYDQVVSVQ
jgi:flagellar basal-body rod modification protein FlgD